MVREREVSLISGAPILMGLLAALVLIISGMIYTARMHHALSPATIGWTELLGLFLLVADIFCLAGLFKVNPNEAKVLQLFGKYVGTVRSAGLKWANPLYSKRRVSTRIRNFESGQLKVNEHDGIPIEIAAIVVWRVIDTAEASFEVDDYQNYVHIQSEAAVRNLATQYPYDAHVDGALSLRGSTLEIAQQMQKEIQDRLAKAGVEVIEARISHLAYSPEIAGAMLRRQQAGAVVAARQKIVEGAVGMVDMALEMLRAKNVVELDEDRKAAMVSNLLVVLCGEHDARPVVNTGSIYH